MTITEQVTIGDGGLPIHRASIDCSYDRAPSTLSAFAVSRFLGVSFTEVVSKMSVQSIDLLAEYVSQLNRQSQPTKVVIPKHLPLDGWCIRRPKKQSHRRMAVYAKRCL